MQPQADPEVVLLGKAGESEMHLQIKRLCARLLPGWRAVPLDQMEVEPISGGISNLLVKVSPACVHGLEPVAFKVFGNKTELLIDRDAEVQTLLTLNSCGFGAKVLGFFANGRIEEFLIAKTLTPQEMGHPDFVPRIARTLRRLHAVPTDGRPTLWSTILRWFDMASQLSFEDLAKREQFARVRLDEMKQEIDETKSLCDEVGSPIVFSHNDLLSGNILIVQQRQKQQQQQEQQEQQEQQQQQPQAAGDSGHSASHPRDEGEMQFIDYEYSACGYRGFDFGNHFNEYAGFECDYTRYPDSRAQHLFFTHYLSEAGGGSGGEAASTSGGDGCTGASAGAAGQGGPEATAPSAEQLLRLEAEANLFALASHIYWGVWALIQARYSPIDFDYLQYSATRWEEFHRRKNEFVGQARRVLLGNTSTPN